MQITWWEQATCLKLLAGENLYVRRLREWEMMLSQLRRSWQCEEYPPTPGRSWRCEEYPPTPVCSCQFEGQGQPTTCEDWSSSYKRGRMASGLYQKYSRLNVRSKRTSGTYGSVQTYVSLVNVRLEMTYDLSSSKCSAGGYWPARLVASIQAALYHQGTSSPQKEACVKEAS